MGIALEDLLLVLGGQAGRGVDVALGVVVVEAGLRVDAAHRAHHLGGEQDVVGRDHLEQQLDARQVIDAGVLCVALYLCWRLLNYATFIFFVFLLSTLKE